MNKVCIIGRLTRDPEVRVSQDGTHTIVKFGIAVDRQKDKVDFFSMTAFDKTAQFCEKYLKKGTKIGVEGQLRADDYTDKNGQKCTSVYILADRIDFCEAKKTVETGNEAGGVKDVPDDINDELPFKF